MIRRVVIAVGATLAFASLSGCAFDTRIPKPDRTLPTAYESPQSAPGDARAAALPAAALDRWWLSFNDPQLTALIEQALVASPDAKTALSKLKEAGATLAETVFSLLPQGDIKGSAADQRVRTGYKDVPASLLPFLSTFSSSGDNKLYSGGLNVSWELDVFGGKRVAIRVGKDDLAAARFDYEATRMSLAASVASSLFQARGLAVQLEDARENARLARQLALTARRKADAGLATTADAARLESDALASDAQISALDAQLKGTQRSLLILVGRGADPSASLPIEARVYTPPPPPVATPGELLTRRPDVREAEARVRSAVGRLTLDKLQMLPDLTLQPSDTIQRQVTGYTTTTRTASIGLGVTVPFLSLPKLGAEVRAQGARGEQAVAAYEKAIQTAYGDAERGLTTLASDQTRVILLKTATDKARFGFDAASKGYGLGLTDITILVQAEQAWRQTRASYTSAQIATLQDSVATFKALGGGWNPHGDDRK